jgi:hypothetical protein
MHIFADFFTRISAIIIKKPYGRFVWKAGEFLRGNLIGLPESEKEG